MVQIHAITLDELYNQLTLKIGFCFDFKVFNITDFNQFVLCFCQDTINIQLSHGTFVAYPIYEMPNMYAQYSQMPMMAHQVHQTHQVYPMHSAHQTHRTTYSQSEYPTYSGYDNYYNNGYSKTS